MSESDQYKLKWKGRQSGPYSVAEIRSQLDQREISLMHEVLYSGEWITLRVFLQRVEPPRARPAAKTTPGPPAASQSAHLREPVQKPGAPQKQLPPTAEPPRLPDPDISRSGLPEKIRPGYEETAPAAASRFQESVSETLQPASPETDQWAAQPGAAAAAAGPGGFFHAGFWLRSGALLFDGAIVAGFIFGLKVLGVFELPALPHTQSELTGLISGAFRENLLATVSFLILLWLYFALFECSRLHATPGKRIAGLRVVRSTGHSLDFPTAGKRFAGKLLSGILLCWGFFLAAFTERRQALHDVLADTVVLGTSPGSQVINPITS